MKSSRWLIATLPLVLAALAFGLFKGSGGASWAYTWAGLLSRAAAAVGCGLAAAQFDRGDYMRKAWTAMGLTYLILLVYAALFGGAHLIGDLLPVTVAGIVGGILVGVANVFTIVGEVLVARTWSAAGMDFEVSRAVKVAAVVGSLLLALVIAGGSAWADLQLVLQGNYASLSDLFSAMGDIVALAVLAPIVLTALSLRGGSLFWPWGMLALGTVAWVLFDGTYTFSGWFGIASEHVRPLAQAFAVGGSLAYLSAGLFQRSARIEVAAPAPQVALG
jgi:hypothetical protein